MRPCFPELFVECICRISSSREGSHTKKKFHDVLRVAARKVPMAQASRANRVGCRNRSVLEMRLAWIGRVACGVVPAAPTHISSLPQPSRGEFRKALGKGGCRCFPHYGSSRQWAIPTGSACCNIHHVTLGIPRHLENPTHGPNLEVGYLGHHGEFGVAIFVDFDLCSFGTRWKRPREAWGFQELSRDVWSAVHGFLKLRDIINIRFFWLKTRHL